MLLQGAVDSCSMEFVDMQLLESFENSLMASSGGFCHHDAELTVIFCFLMPRPLVGAALPAMSCRHGKSRTEMIVREVKILLEQHAAKTASIEQLSTRYQLSERQLCRVFKKYTGLTPYQYYLQFRIQRAKEMLWNTTLSLKEIAASLQFENSCHFSKLFKKKTGMLPSQWPRGGCSDPGAS